MKKTVITSILGLALTTAAMAQDYATVVNVQPRMVTVQQQQCRQVVVNSDNSTAGTIIGGVAGGIIGNQVGKGSGRDAATALGAVTGAIVGNRIGSDHGSQQIRQVCEYVPVTIQQGEIITFSYRGRHFTQVFN